MKIASFVAGLLLLSFLVSCSPQPSGRSICLERAKQTLDSLKVCYSVDSSHLFRENHPFDQSYMATCLDSEVPQNQPNQYSFLWAYSAVFSAGVALLQATDDEASRQFLEKRMLPGLEEYFDTQREPSAYSSYVLTAPVAQRFYDDNIWVGINFINLYGLIPEQKYLEKAQLIWKFVESGSDSCLGGGTYWCEQTKGSKNTCSNAPGAVLAFKLFQATGDSIYFEGGLERYEWTKKNLQDTTDYLYFDNIEIDGTIGKAKFAYNSGQMMQAAALLYRLTGSSAYLADAQNIAKEAYYYFFTEVATPAGDRMKLVRKGDVWFTAVMLRGFLELYECDKNAIYIDAFEQSLDYAWDHAREKNGLFNVDFSGADRDNRNWLLTQAAMVEMYARLAAIKL